MDFRSTKLRIVCPRAGVQAGLYVAAIALLVPLTIASWAGLGEFSGASEIWNTPKAASEGQPTHLDQVVSNAREIRAALQKPIPGPEPLPPITEKVAFGHLKSGGRDARAITVFALRNSRPASTASGISSLTYVTLRP